MNLSRKLVYIEVAECPRRRWSGSGISSDLLYTYPNVKMSSWVFGSLLGESTHVSNGKIKQICIKPFAHGWHRFTGVIAAVSGYTTLHVQSSKGGVTFGTSMFSPPADRKPKNVYATPVQGPGLRREVNGKLKRRKQDAVY